MLKSLTTDNIELRDSTSEPVSIPPSPNPMPLPPNVPRVEPPKGNPLILPDGSINLFNFVNKLESDNPNETVLYLNRQVEDLTILPLVEKLDRVKPGSKVTLYINSPGGCVKSGGILCSKINSLKDKNVHVHTVCVGLAASMGASIWTYGHTVDIMPNSFVMYHMSSHMGWGNSETIKEEAKNIINYVKSTSLYRALQLGYLLQDEYNDLVNHCKDIFISYSQMKSRLNK